MVVVGISRSTRRAVKISKGTSDPDNLEPEKASHCRKVFDSPFPILRPKTRVFPEGPDMFSDTCNGQGKRGSGEEEDPRGEERTDMLPATDMSLISRASYYYSGWLCGALSSAILSGHGY